ncbi:MAG: hypothetical protein RL177_863, partial [Bacteroidota bacterium]
MKRIYLLLALFISLAPVSLLAQTQGQVFKPASGTRSNGQLVLDPNGDGFVSKASCAERTNLSRPVRFVACEGYFCIIGDAKGNNGLNIGCFGRDDRLCARTGKNQP